MRVNGALRLCFLLLGLCQACRARPPGGPYTTREVGEVPVSQLRMLSLGLAHLLQGLVENVEQLELRGKLVAAGLDEAAESLESLRKQSLQAGRTHRQARKDLQILTARGDGLWRAATDLQEELVDGQRERKAMQRRTNRIIQKVKSRTEPRSVKDIMDQQARRLATLTSEVSARDRMIDRRLRHINQLEKRSLLAARGADSVPDEHSCLNTAAPPAGRRDKGSVRLTKQPALQQTQRRPTINRRACQ
ncbi:uncharacterized protein LOC120831906 [Gasterosteus aculeatus]